MKNYDCISYKNADIIPGQTYSGNLFWDWISVQPCTFSGCVYQGDPPDQSTPLSGIKVELYGDVNEWPNDGPKTLLASTNTGGSGTFTLTGSAGAASYNYYHVIETDAPNSYSTGASAQSPGYVKNYNCVSYRNGDITPGSTYSGIAFWDQSSGSTKTQNIPLAQGWSWISLNVQPSDLAADKVTAGLSGLAILVNSDGQFYIPSVVNSIGQWDMLQGYKVYMNGNGQLSVAGQKLAAGTPISLASGWSFVSYLPGTVLSAETALASIGAQLAIAKNDIGGFYIPGVVNTLGSMSPGEGYKLYMKSAQTLVYPSGSSQYAANLRLSCCMPERAPHFRHRERTGENHCILVRSVMLKRNQEDAIEIGIFTEAGLCAGSGICTSGGVTAIAAWADDEKTGQIDGYRPGERMEFKYWDAGLERAFPLTGRFDQGSGLFDEGAYTSVHLESITSPARMDLKQNYPNPFNSRTGIVFELARAQSVELDVYSLLGEKVAGLGGNFREAGVHRASWDGRDSDGELVASGIYLIVLKAGPESRCIKAVFIR